MQLMLRNYRSGFTLIEVLLSISVIGVIAAIGAPMFNRAIWRNDLDMTVATLVQSWRRGQVLAVANDGDMVWGVRVQAGSITVFRGTDYASRDVDYDEVFSMPATILVSGTVAEITFGKLTGTPSATGTVSLTGFDEGRTLTINSKGMVSY